MAGIGSFMPHPTLVRLNPGYCRLVSPLLQYSVEALTCADSGVVVCQQEAFHPVLHVLQHPAVGQFVPGSLDCQPVQTLGRVVLDHLTGRTQTHMKTHTIIQKDAMASLCGTEIKIKDPPLMKNSF